VRGSRTPPSRSGSRPLWLVAGEIAAVVACTALVVPLARRTGVAVHELGDALVLAVGALTGYLLADLASGVVHWLCDTFLAEDTPVIGRALIAPFREHHRDPLMITRRGFLEVNGSSCLAVLPLLAWASRQSTPAGAEAVALLRDGFCLAAALGALLTNQFHKWAHAPTVVRPVRWAQRARLVLAPEQHARHHAAGAARAYCVTAGWLNPLLDGLGVFSGLERGLRTLGALLSSRARRGGRRDPGGHRAWDRT
jgi:plasmanylethanolamine desaturase